MFEDIIEEEEDLAHEQEDGVLEDEVVGKSVQDASQVD